MTLSQISQRLARSVSELFRMVQVLEARGYVAMSQGGEGFELTNKLFSLGISRGPSQNLLASAMPLMQTLSEETRQACHLAIVSDDRMVVIARVEATGDLGFSVRVGYQRPLAHSTSGLIIYAFQKPKIREQWRRTLRPALTQDEWATFEAQAERALSQGHFTSPSEYIDGITDLSAPIASDAGVIAAMRAHNVWIGRTWPVWPNAVRVSVGTPQEMAKFKTAFKAVMDGKAALAWNAPTGGAETPRFPHLS